MGFPKHPMVHYKFMTRFHWNSDSPKILVNRNHINWNYSPKTQLISRLKKGLHNFWGSSPDSNRLVNWSKKLLLFRWNWLYAPVFSESDRFFTEKKFSVNRNFSETGIRRIITSGKKFFESFPFLFFSFQTRPHQFFIEKLKIQRFSIFRCLVIALSLYPFL